MVAVALSLALHFVLLLCVSVNPTGGAAKVAATIYARLDPATPEPAAADHPPPDALLIPAETGAVAPAQAVESKPLPPQSQVEAETKPGPDPITPPTYSSAIHFELPLIRDPTYYPAKQLDVYPQPLTAIKLDIVDVAADRRIRRRQ